MYSLGGGGRRHAVGEVAESCQSQHGRRVLHVTRGRARVAKSVVVVVAVCVGGVGGDAAPRGW